MEGIVLHERDLIRRIGEGDDASLAQLYDRFGQVVYNFLYYSIRSVEEAEALTQDVFLTVWQKASSIDLQNGTIEDWIFRKAKELAVIRFQSKIHSPTATQQFPGNAQTFVEKETQRIHEISSVNPLSLKNVLLNPEVKENIFFTIQVAQIAGAEKRTPAKKEEGENPISTYPAMWALWLRRKFSWYLIGKVCGAVVVLIFVGIFIHALLSTINRREEVIARQQNRNVQLEREIGEQQPVVDFFHARRLSMLVLAGLSEDSLVSGKIFWDPDKKTALLQFLNLRATSPNEHYRLWVTRNSVVENVCTFEISQPGTSFCKIIPLDLLLPPKVSVIELTVESKDGISTPAGEAVLSAVFPHVIIFG